MDSITPGPRDHLITRALERALAALDPDLLVSNDLDNAEAPERLSRHLMTEVRRELTGRESADAQAADLNRLLGKALPTGDAGDAEIVLPARILQGIRDRSPLGDPLDLPPAPATPLGQSDLLVNAEGQPNIGAELRSELASADSVDLICAFVIWSGVRHLRDALAEVVDRGGPRRRGGARRHQALRVPRTEVTMLAWGLGSGGSGHGTLGDYLAALWCEVAVRGELLEILDSLDARSQTVAAPSPLSPEIPLTVHARYSRQEIVAALGFGSGVKPKVTQGGILWIPEVRSDVFFVDLQKAERDYSPTTMYRDYAMSRDLFHWESQSRQTPEQPSVQRYINHAKQGTNVLLCVREQRRGELGAAPYHFLGPVDHVSHAGERPVAFTWRLRTPMPEALFEVARSVAA